MSDILDLNPAPDEGPEASGSDENLLGVRDTESRNVTQRRMTAIARLAGLIGGARFPTGDRARLRRLHPASPDGSAFWRLLLEQVPDEERRGAESESRWAVLMQGMALMSGPVASPHRQGARLGAVLAELGYSELRLTRLLRAREPKDLAEHVPRLARFLAAKGSAIDWARFGLLILARSEESAENHRRAIARDYFGHRSRQQHTDQE